MISIRTAIHEYVLSAKDIDRFYSKFEQGEGCWVWRGTLRSQRPKFRYGALKVNGKMISAHRISYELFKGPIAEGLVIDHLCRNESCVNPSHLEAVTQAVNTQRTIPFSTKHYRDKTHCSRGHELTVDNVWIRHLQNDGIGRVCLVCSKARRAYYKARTGE